MNITKYDKGSQYLNTKNTGSPTIAKTDKVKPLILSTLCMFAAIIFMITSAVSSGIIPVGDNRTSSNKTVYAEDNSDFEKESKDAIEDKAKEYIGNIKDDSNDRASDETDSDDAGAANTFSRMLEQADSEEADSESFNAVIKRLFSTGYLNNTDHAAVAEGENGFDNSGWNCKKEGATLKDSNVVINNTALYHNCDVPNILTEFMQTFVNTLSQAGIQGGERQQNKLKWESIGLPGNIPNGGAPVDPKDRDVKYTGLELFGYNLRMTQYTGEWDNIKVLTEGRTLSNFGFFDWIGLGVKAVYEGIKGAFNGAIEGAKEGAQKAAEKISEGCDPGLSVDQITGCVTSITGGALEVFRSTAAGFAGGAISSLIVLVLDTSEQNVFATNAWYRINYGGTLYNARELNNLEIAKNWQYQYISNLLQKEPGYYQVPPEMQELSHGPSKPREAISKCVLTGTGAMNKEWGHSVVAPGPSKEECMRQGEVEYQKRKYQGVKIPGDSADVKWTKDGTQKAESMIEWAANNSALIDKAKEFGMNCTIDTDDGNRDKTIANLQACWDTSYKDALDTKLEGLIQLDWLESRDDTELPNAEDFGEYIKKDSKVRNPNAPWNRFVCVDKNGDDVRNGLSYKMAWDHKGNYMCDKPMRAPIQDGVFGNGYPTEKGQQPEIDTRREKLSTSVFDYIVPTDAIVTNISNMGLQLASFLTRISNTTLNLAFSPILQTLGLDKLVVKIVENFKESIYYPLVSLIVMIAGVMMLWRAGRHREYKKQAMSALIMTATIMVGIFFMERPKQNIEMVDNLPAMIERTIVGTIFNVTNDDVDNLCNASGTVTADAGEDLNGDTLNFSPGDSTRTLLCENWRAFLLTPWSFGQWGTSIDNLYASNTQTNSENKMHNTNENLVGDAEVDLGGGRIMNNWAIYQIDKMGSGTASKEDLTRPSGATDSELYRIVDLQAGPNNGEGTDSRYFDAWSGANWGTRLTVGFVSPIVAATGMFAIVTYSVTKIVISFTTVLLLMMLPIFLLMGIHPTAGRQKLKAYAGTLIALMVQRVLLVTLLAVMISIVIAVVNSTSNYLMGAMVAVGTCMLFIMYRKEILDMVFSAISSSMGRNVGGEYINDPNKWAKETLVKPNGYIENRLEWASAGGKGLVSGGIAGFMTGGVKNVGRSAFESAKAEQQSLQFRQRRKGFGPVETALQSGRAGKNTAVKDLYKNAEAQKIASEVVNRRQNETYKKQKEKFNTDNKIYERMAEQEFRDSNGQFYKIDEKGEQMYRPVEPVKPEPVPVPNTFKNSSRNNRDLSKVIKRQDNQAMRQGSKAERKYAQANNDYTTNWNENVNKERTNFNNMSEEERQEFNNTKRQEARTHKNNNNSNDKNIVEKVQDNDTQSRMNRLERNSNRQVKKQNKINEREIKRKEKNSRKLSKQDYNAEDYIRRSEENNKKRK